MFVLGLIIGALGGATFATFLLSALALAKRSDEQTACLEMRSEEETDAYHKMLRR